MRSLRFFLALLVFGAVVPGLVFGVGVSWWLATEMRLNSEREAQNLAEEIAANVSEHVRLVTAAMKVLARSPALAREDLAKAYSFARLLASDLDQHIGLATADGRQLFNTRRPFGSPLPDRADATSYSRALRTGQPSVSNIIIGAVAQRPLITIDIPAYTTNGTRVLGTSTDVSVIGDVLARRTLQPGWRGAVVDGEGRFIASTADKTVIGQIGMAEIVAVAKQGAPQGKFSHHHLQSGQLVSFFSKIQGTDWVVIVGIPEPVFLAPLRGLFVVLSASGAAAIGLTLLTAFILARRLNTAARRLTSDAIALGRGDELSPPVQTISEFEQVQKVLHHGVAQAKMRQEELARAWETAERSVTVKNRFFAAASHDLRQPLQAAGLYIELLRQQAGPNQMQSTYLDALSQAHTSMTDLIGTLFDIAKIDSEALPPHLIEVPLSNVVNQIASECRPSAEEKGLRLVSDCGALNILSDAEMLARIIRNLVHNAIRYTETGAVVVRCRRRATEVRVEVWDTGIGIARDQSDLIWEEFYQVGQRATATGSGLGLSIVSRLANLLGYKIEVRSKQGKGSMFRVIIPQPSAPSSGEHH